MQYKESKRIVVYNKILLRYSVVLLLDNYLYG